MTNNIVLVYPYFKTDDPREPLFRPLGVTSLASQMKSLGLPVFITDCTFRTYEESVREVVDRDPAIIGVHVAVGMVEDALRMVRELRERLPGTLFVAGGPLATVYPGRFAEIFDVVFRGEGDLVVPRFCRDYLALHKRDRFHHVLEFYTYPGIYTMFRDQCIQYAPIHYPTPILDTLPVPYRRDIDHARYQSHWMTAFGVKPVTLLASRGCPEDGDGGANPVFGRSYRKRSIERVTREIDVVERDGYDQVCFVDDCFTFDRANVLAFCEAMATRPRTISWTCSARVNGLAPDLVNAMRDAGCVKISLALDSGDDETLRRMGRRMTVRDSLRAVDMLSQTGIMIDAGFIVGYPGESVASVEKTLSFALSLPLDSLSFNAAFHLSGSNAHEADPLSFGEAATGRAGERMFLYSGEIDENWLRDRVSQALGEFRQSREPISSLSPAMPA